LVRIPAVVAAEEGDMAAGGGLDPGVARGRHPAVAGLADRHHARVGGGLGLDQLPGGIGGAVVDHQQLHRRMGLLQCGPHRRLQRRARVVGGHHHADPIHLHRSPARRSRYKRRNWPEPGTARHPRCPDRRRETVLSCSTIATPGRAPASAGSAPPAPPQPAGAESRCPSRPRGGNGRNGRPMKILALTNLYPNPLQPHRAAFNRHRFRFLAADHELRMIAPVSWRDEWALRGTGPGIARDRRTTLDGIPVAHPRYWYTPGVLRGQYGRFFHASVRATFDRAVRESRPDVVLATWAYPDGWAAVRLARSHGLPVVVMVHGSDVRRMDEVPARSRGTREALCAADGVIAVSADLAARVVALGADPDRVLTVLDGVDRTLFNPGDRTQARRALGLADDERHLLFIGNLLPVKG